MTKATPKIWDEHANWWRLNFTNGADPEYEREIIPLIVKLLGSFDRLLDIGCGEGQVARQLARAPRSGVVVGLDPSAKQLANAIQAEAVIRAVNAAALSRGSPDETEPETPLLGVAAFAEVGDEPAANAKGRSPIFVQGRAEEMPFSSQSFDAALCCLVIEHTEDIDAVLTEVGRVLVPGGRFLLVINHPLYQGIGSGFIDDQILNEHYWRVGPYLEERVELEEVDSGVSLPFAHRPLSRYINPLSQSDLVLVTMVEPPPPQDLLDGSIDPDLEARIPRLMALLFEQRPSIRGQASMAPGHARGL